MNNSVAMWLHLVNKTSKTQDCVKKQGLRKKGSLLLSQEEILRFIKKFKKGITVKQLGENFEVSEITLRKYVEKMVKENILKKEFKNVRNKRAGVYQAK